MANDGPPGHNKKTKIIDRVNKKVVNESHLHVLTETDGEIDVTQLQQISVDPYSHWLSLDTTPLSIPGCLKPLDYERGDWFIFFRFESVIAITSCLMDGRRSGNGLGEYSSPGGYTMQMVYIGIHWLVAEIQSSATGRKIKKI